jgi:hypothetical protein
MQPPKLLPAQQNPFQSRPTDVITAVQVPLTINFRLLLQGAPVDLLYRLRDQVNELINQHQNGGKK